MIKQVTVVNGTYSNAPRGFLCAQVAHAVLGVIFRAMDKMDDVTWYLEDDEHIHMDTSNLNWDFWFNDAWVKIVVVTDSTNFYNAMRLCRSMGWTIYPIKDNVPGENGDRVTTCFAIEPLAAEDVDQVTGSFATLK